MEKAKLEALKIDLQRQYVASVPKVLKYLKAHPKVKRTFVKNGSPYYLDKIDCDDNPVYINTKNSESGALIEAYKLYKGGSIGGFHYKFAQIYGFK